MSESSLSNPRGKTRIGLFIPMAEEFRVLQEVFTLKPRTSDLVQVWEVEGFKKSGEQLSWLEILVFRPSAMGNLFAYERTLDFLALERVSLVVAVGIGGAIDSDLRLGDVAVATNIVDIVDASKVRNVPGEHGAEVNYSLKINQRPVIPDELLLREFANFLEISHASKITAWRDECREFATQRDPSFDLVPSSAFYRSMLFPKNINNGSAPTNAHGNSSDSIAASHWFSLKGWPHIVQGHFASGLVVGADGLDLTERNREFKVVETEGYGVGKACSRLGVPFAVLRGISDFADGKKRDTAFRPIAAYNALSYFAAFVRSDRFRQIRYRMLPYDYDISAKLKVLLETGRATIANEETPLLYGLMALLIRTAEQEIAQLMQAESQDSDRNLYVSAIDLSTVYPVVRNIGNEGRQRISHVYILKRERGVDSKVTSRFQENLKGIKAYFRNDKVIVTEEPDYDVPVSGMLYGDFLNFEIRSKCPKFGPSDGIDQSQFAPSEVINVRLLHREYGRLAEYFKHVCKGSQSSPSVGK